MIPSYLFPFSVFGPRFGRFRQPNSLLCRPAFCAAKMFRHVCYFAGKTQSRDGIAFETFRWCIFHGKKLHERNITPFVPVYEPVRGFLTTVIFGKNRLSQACSNKRRELY